MIVVTLRNPEAAVPDWINPKASARCSELISLTGNPLRGRGMKCQSSRSGASKGNVALAAWSFDNEVRNRSAATAMWLPVCSTYAPAQRASATTTIAANTRLSLTPRMNVTPFGNTEGCGIARFQSLTSSSPPGAKSSPAWVFSQSLFGSTLVSKSSLFTIARIAGIAMETSQAALEPNRYLCLAEQGPAHSGAWLSKTSDYRLV